MDPSVVEVVVEAFPWFEPWVDTAYVTITAIPGTIAAVVTGLPVWLYGLFGAGFLGFAWCYLEDKDDCYW